MTTRRGIGRPTSDPGRPPGSSRPRQGPTAAAGPGRLADAPPDPARRGHADRRPDRAVARDRRPRRPASCTSGPAGSAGRGRRRRHDAGGLRRRRHRRPPARARPPRSSATPPSLERPTSRTRTADGRPRRDRPGLDGRRHDARHPGLPRAAGPERRRRSRRCRSARPPRPRPGRADQGHQRLHGRRSSAPAASPRPSAIVRYILDTTKPKMTITVAEGDAVVNGKTRDDQGQDPGPLDAAGRAIRPTAPRASGPARPTTTASSAQPPDRDRPATRSASTATDPAGNAAAVVADRQSRRGQADRVARGVGLPDRRARRCPSDHADGRRRPTRTGNPLEGRRRDVHAEHPGHPDRHPDADDRRRTGGRAGRRRSRRARRSARAAPRSSSTSRDFGRHRTRRSSRSSSSAGATRARPSTARRVAATIRRHADVAMPALRDPPGRDGPLLGLPTIQHGLRDLSALPPLRRRRTWATAASTAPRAAHR